MEATEKGSQILGQLGMKIDESRTDRYDDTLVLWSNHDNAYSLWIEYKGGTYDLTSFQVLYLEQINGSMPDPVSDAEETTIREALQDIGFSIPMGVQFTNLGEGEYVFTAHMLETENGFLDGTIRCTYYGEKGIGRIADNMLTCIPYKEYAAISEQEAYEKIINGEFLRLENEHLEIEVNSCELVYTMDSKGFYQPTYQFEVLINGIENAILIPAYK